MAHGFYDIFFTDAVKAEQSQAGSRTSYARFDGADQDTHRTLGPDEAAFIESRTSLYLATVNPDGWPYIQHRGGAPGFCKVVDNRTLAMPDYAGNRQYISTGNLAGHDKISLFMMDYARQARLKLIGRAQVVSALDPRLPETHGHTPERGLVIQVDGFDWNCPKYIPRMYSEADVQGALAQMGARIAELEAALAAKV